jgi:tRNA pseudouridine55 synthase
VVLAERVVHVARFEQRWREGDRAAFVIECSAGTYVRSLIADLGDAYCEELRRTAIGAFRVEDVDPATIIGLAQALSFLPTVELSGEDARRAAHGVAVPGQAEGHVLLADGDGPIAVAEARAGVGLKPVVGFRG